MAQEMVIPLTEAARRLGVTVAEVAQAIHDGRLRIRLTIDPKPVTVDARPRPH